MPTRRFSLLVVFAFVVTATVAATSQVSLAQQLPAPAAYPPPGTTQPQTALSQAAPTPSQQYFPQQFEQQNYPQQDYPQQDYVQQGLAPQEYAAANSTLELGPIVDGSTPANQMPSSPMLWQQYQALQTGGSLQAGCQSCSGNSGSDYKRCGCNTKVFPWIDGPGNCDQWCVGPKWAIEGGGLMMFRDDADWDRVIADVGAATTQVNQFEHGPGGRVSVTGYNQSGFGIQVGYEGINDWDGNLAFVPGGGTTREFTYESRLNSVEINFITNNPSPWKLFSGFRFVQFDEDFIDLTRADRVLPPPATPAGTSQSIDQAVNRLLENRLFGLQLGGRRDAWQFGNRFTVQTFANAGVYCNKFRREDVDLTVTTTISGDDTATTTVTELTESSSSFNTTTRTDINQIAFVGEAGIAAAWRLNHCTAVRAGYQILALDGVMQGLEASFTPGFASDTLIFHGLQFGVEYRR